MSETEPLTLRFGTPSHGWLDVELVGPGGASRVDASDVPGDSLAMLVDAARDLVEGLDAREVTWFLEPAEVTWSFQRLGDRIEIVARSERSERVRVGVASAAEIGWLVWRALRRLEMDPVWKGDADQVWTQPFPSAQVAALGERLSELYGSTG